VSVRPANDPLCRERRPTPEVAQVIDARARDVEGLKVRRLLPSAARRLVGPFIFFDHVGPSDVAPGEAVNVRPHRHIGLATVTYLFDGEIVHRDSLGSQQIIRPGEINWMTAGRGIVHSERTSPVSTSYRFHGLQLWVALPVAMEEADPSFAHHAGGTLPELDQGGAHIRVLAGRAYGVTSPVRTASPLFYVDVAMPAGSQLPMDRDHDERALYVVDGAVRCGTKRAEPGRMLVFASDAPIVLHAERDSRVVLVGGDRMEGSRHIWWNFVSSSKERIEQAKDDWKAGRFPKVPGDEDEVIPLPAG
jgi:redox-sensitive bicupin YhaK (pirin superfamily)